MSNAKGKHVDSAFISLRSLEETGAGRRVHRDYLAHCFRWTHAMKVLSDVKRASKGKPVSLLDVGCGKEVVLLDTLYSNLVYPDRYVGVEYGPIVQPREFKKVDVELHDKTDFTMFETDERFQMVTCFEVIEHVEPAVALEILINIQRLLSPNGLALISTPVFNPKQGAADIHVNEMSFDAVAWMMARANLIVENVYGTFASKRDLEAALAETPEHLKTYKSLAKYYDFGILSTMFAPLVPKSSRNCLWVARRPVSWIETAYRLDPPADPSNSSSEQWPEFIAQFAK